jgi:hypothetical protein
MSLQRSLQKGRQGEAADHCTARLQVGQATVVMTQLMAVTSKSSFRCSLD